MKPIYSYAGSAVRILTFPLEEGVRSCSFLSTIDNSTKFSSAYTENYGRNIFFFIIYLFKAGCFFSKVADLPESPAIKQTTKQTNNKAQKGRK